jgi:uncharacterized protein YkwD
MGAMAMPAASPTTEPRQVADSHRSGPQQAQLSAGPDYQASVLYHHNVARANHNAMPLTWDAKCEANARIAAQRCTFEHYIPQGAGQGQNIWASYGSFNVTGGITENWYNSELPLMMPYFGQADIPSQAFGSVAHLTQMAWKPTTGVGCASVDCRGKMKVYGQLSNIDKFTVCNYAPAGNVFGRFAQNVDPPRSTTNLARWTD